MNILFTDTGQNQCTEWQGQDKKAVKRIKQLLKSMDRDGAMQGIFEAMKAKSRLVEMKSCRQVEK